MEQIEYNVNALKNFDTEWLLHKKCSEWWYSTSILRDGDGKLYTCQFTFLRMRLAPFLKPFILMTAVTDFQTKKHYYSQKFTLSQSKISIDKCRALCGENGVVKNADGMAINIKGEDFSYKLKTSYGKGAFWHCDGGKLFMGREDERQTTFYYSYTNMPTTGEITLGNKTFAVSGTTWFDKQGGTFNFMDIKTHWEWFSMRFYDGEEIMLFNFPQCGYSDGTYIKANSACERLNDYAMKPLGFVENKGYKFSCGWELSLPVKDKKYKIVPVIDGQLNLAYYEQLCYVYDSQGNEVGLCFTELLPGVYNKKISGKLLLKKV